MSWKHQKNLLLLLLLFGGTIALYFWFASTPYYIDFLFWIESNLLLFYLMLFLIKFSGIVWPPIPGGILTLAAIPIIGWERAFIIDFLGEMIGSVVAYYLARYWGENLVKKIVDRKNYEKITSFHVKEKREFELILLLRIFGGTLIEIVCYAAGLMKVRFKPFFLASTIGYSIVGSLTFYFAGSIIEKENLFINILFLAVAIIFFTTLRKRYFVKVKN